MKIAKITIISVAGLLAFLGVTANAVAVPTLRAMLNRGTFGNMNVDTWEDCSGGVGTGRRFSSQAQGWDNSGNFICSASVQSTGTWVVGTDDCSAATQHIAMVRRNFLVDCESSFTSWTVRHHCTVAVAARKLGTSGVCVSDNFRGYAEGAN